MQLLCVSFLHFSFCFLSKTFLFFLNYVVIWDIKSISNVYLQNLCLMNNQPSILLDRLRTSSSSSTTSRYLVCMLYTLHLGNVLLIVNFHMFQIEYKNGSFYSSDMSFEVRGDNSKSTLMTPSLTSSDY